MHIIIAGTDNNGNFTTIEESNGHIIKQESWDTVEKCVNAGMHMKEVYGADMFINFFKGLEGE